MTKSKIEEKAIKVLQDAGAFRVPIQVDRVAMTLGLSVKSVEFGDDVSGVLVVSEAGATIGYNIDQPLVRQRFTIAHELGHYVLHSKSENLFIDRQYAVFRRDQESESGEQILERQANQFAAALLMPQKLLKEELAKIPVDFGDEIGLKYLADKFAVSTQAMSLRLVNLGLIEGH